MTNFYVYSLPNNAHGIWPGKRVSAANATDAMIAYAAAEGVPANIVLAAIPEEAFVFGKTGGIAPVSPPPYV